jgi:protein disulfide-isomerase A1
MEAHQALLQPQEDRKTVAYTGKMTDAEIMKWANIESLPLVTPFSGQFTDRIFAGSNPFHLLIVGELKALTIDNPIFKAFRATAEKMRPEGEFVFVSVDVNDEDAEAVLGFFGIDAAPVPIVLGFQIEPSQRKFRCELEHAHLLSMSYFSCRQIIIIIIINW